MSYAKSITKFKYFYNLGTNFQTNNNTQQTNQLKLGDNLISHFHFIASFNILFHHVYDVSYIVVVS
jgi:hypothetical protein